MLISSGHADNVFAVWACGEEREFRICESGKNSMLRKVIRPASSSVATRIATALQPRTMSTSSIKLTASNINKQLVQAEYAVRGELVIKADEYRKQINAKPDSHGLPFNKIIACNIGNPHELGQKPITFFRQVLALCQYPDLLNSPAASQLFPADAIARAKAYLSKISTVGAYTHSKGLANVREEVAQFVKERDGFATDPENIFITDGASAGVKMLLNTLIRDNKDGVLCPIPQYPLYSASMTLYGGSLVGYYLNEEKGWAMDVKELERAYKEATDKGINVRAIAIINPGNPTGQCLTASNMQDIVRFCVRNNLVILADEVYQTNIYSTTPFTSFRKVVKTMGDEAKEAQLVSFHSVSKGFLGECGQRGGYFHLTNIDASVTAQLYKLASISLCSNVTGQLTVGLMVNPPRQGDASYSQYATERDSILDSLKRRAQKVAKALNELEGVSCQPVEGALYAFPRITLPAKAMDEAKSRGKAPDTMYALELLDATGICVVPGTGFSQVPGTFHYRTTILPSEKDLDTVIAAVKKFHENFMAKYK